MKSRSREVNIFNMSLLDILCGALGAFCFMMLVLFPAYQQAQAEGGAGADTAEQLKMARARAEKAEAEARQAKAAAQQAKTEAQQAKKDADQYFSKADVAKRPMLVEASWTNTGSEVNIYVRFRGKNEKGQDASGPPFDPNVKPAPTFTGDSAYTWGGNTAFWILRDTPTAEYEVYYRLAKQADPKQPVVVNGVYASDGEIATLPPARLDGAQKGAFVGTIVRTADKKLQFRPNAGGK
jgi:hypothetical protein